MGKKKKVVNKKQAQKIHFKRAFQDRFGIEINRLDIADLVNDIHNGNNILMSESLSHRVTAHTMIFMRKKCVVLYDKIRKVPITALTTDMEYKSYSGSTSKHGTERMFR